MGWVEQEITDYTKTAECLPPLWDSLRDSIGRAVEDFKALVSQPGVGRADCHARGPKCVRVQKPGASLEIFLSPLDKQIKNAPGTLALDSTHDYPEETTICGYRLKVDRSGLEFCSLTGETLTADDVSKLALRRFLLDPFPAAYVRPQKTPMV